MEVIQTMYWTNLSDTDMLRLAGTSRRPKGRRIHVNRSEVSVSS
jgi:hypothetical protein